MAKLLWNLRYTLYAKAHGLSETGMLQKDEADWPGGMMCGFILWTSEHWGKYAALRITAGNPIGKCGPSEKDHRLFDVWLALHVTANLLIKDRRDKDNGSKEKSNSESSNTEEGNTISKA